MLKKQLLFATIICGCLSSEVPSVVTKSGKILGHYLTSYGGKKYEAYQGIPYAIPPVGNRRFKPPSPIHAWSSELVANHLRSVCWQHNRTPLPLGKHIKGDEDCLYLNVFVPERKTNGFLPVLFWIHGGAFQFDSNQPEEEAYLMDYDVILVTIQYRLGALGFLSTEDDVVSGNMGLKDQSLALRWVNENIEHFGGDPKRITLFGMSAGGASVHYHYLSPMSAGLFRNGISYSGTAFDSWAQTRKNPRERALEMGRLMNCTTSNVEEMVHCLRESPARKLVELQAKFQPWHMTPPVPFGPVVEKFAKEPFIDRTPFEIVESGKAYDAPWITGVVSEEGFYPAIEWADEDTLKEINDGWNKIAPFMLDYNNTIPKENHTRLARTVRKQYFGDKPIDKDSFMKLAYLIGDRWFFVGANNAARAQAKANKSPVLFYYYSYRAVDSMSFELSNNTEFSGVSHGDDIYLCMKDSLMSPSKSPRDTAMQKVLLKLLTSFATDGKPEVNVAWSKVDSSNNLNYLHIAGPENQNISTKMNENLGQRIFWNSIDFH